VTKSYEDELEEIRLANDGMLRPEDVVEYARDKSTQLHKRFDWSDRVAAGKWRLEQARQLIRVCVRMLPTKGEEMGIVSVRSYISLPSDRISGEGYRTLTDILEDENKTSELLALLVADMRIFRRKYEHFVSLRLALAHVDRAIKDIEDMSSETAPARAAGRTGKRSGGAQHRRAA
jgi:hypothetical protein